MHSRYFLNEGKFEYIENIKKTKKLKLCKIFLFDDIIVWAKEKKKGLWKYKGTFHMKAVSILDIEGNCGS